MSTDSGKESEPVASPKKWLQKASGLAQSAESPPPDSDAEISQLKVTPMLTLSEAAAMAKCGRERLRQLAAAGEVPATRVGRRWVFSQRLLLEWLEARMKAPREVKRGLYEEPGAALARHLAQQRKERQARKHGGGLKSKETEPRASTISTAGPTRASANRPVPS